MDMNSPLNPTPAMVQDLAPTGKLRVAINFGNAVLAQRNASTGEPCGIAVDLAGALGRQLGVPVELVSFDAAGKVVEALAANRWDLAFLAIDPIRSKEMTFTVPYVIIEATYLVRAESSFKQVGDVDRAGVRIAVGNGAAYELYLTRNLKHAQLIRTPTAAVAFESFCEQGLEAVAGVREVVDGFARSQSGLRLLSDSFMTIDQALAVPKDRTVATAFLNHFIETKKADGSVTASLLGSGQTGAKVAA